MEQLFYKEVKAHFNLRKPNSDKPTNVYMVVFMNGKQYKLSIGCKVYPSQWDFKNQQAIISYRYTTVDNRNNTIVNDKILSAIDNFNNHISKLLEGSTTDLIKPTKKINAIDWYIKHIDSQNDVILSKATKTQYRNVIKLLEQYTISLGKTSLSFDMITESYIKSFINWLFEPYNDKGDIRSTRTVYGYVVALKTVLCYADLSAETIASIKNIPNVKVKQDKTKIVLTDDELLQLYLAKGLTKAQARVRDLFILQCEIGQRYEDMENLHTAIRNEDTLEIIQLKTQEPISIPLTPIAKDILDKYGLDVHFVNATQVNKVLKDVAKIAGLNRMVKISQEKKGKIVTENLPLYTQISTHTARRSFITNWLKDGLESYHIKTITGHKTDKSFDLYVKIDSQDVAKMMLEKKEQP